MKNIIHYIPRLGFVLFFCSFITFCNKSSYIEGVGYVSTSSSAISNNTKGKITFYTTSLGTCNSTLDIFVDWGDRLGYIQQASTTAPACGTNSSKASTIELEQGSHYFSISNGCKRYTFNETIIKNQCKLIILQ